MKKGKYIDIYVMMACLSRKKRTPKMQNIDELLYKACAGCKEACKNDTYKLTDSRKEALRGL